MRAVLGLLLVMLLSVTSVTAAVARGQMAGAVDMVICAGAGLATVTLDATGQPVEAHHCPVCTAAGSGVGVPVAASVARPATRAEAVRFGAGIALRKVGAGEPVARGPPVLVWTPSLFFRSLT